MYFNSSSGYHSQESVWDRSRSDSVLFEMENWIDEEYGFVNERRLLMRERSPLRDGDWGDRDWEDKRRYYRELMSRNGGGCRDYYRGSPRSGEGASNSRNERFNREISREIYEEYLINADDDREYIRKHDRLQDYAGRKSTSEYNGKCSSRGEYRDDDRKGRDNVKERENSRDRHRSGSRHRDNSRERKRENSSSLSNNDSFESSRNRDSREDARIRRNRCGEKGSSSDFDKSPLNQTPNRTVIVRGMAYHLTESDIWEDMVKCNLVPRDIRLIRNKDTGVSRGFAFVEFSDTSEAVAWMEMKKGELVLKDHYRAEMQYSLQQYNVQKADSETGKRLNEWHCRCLANNFKTRLSCYKCGCSRQDGELAEGYDEVCLHPTHTVFLRGLSTSSTEENVLQCIQSLSALPIRSVEIGRDPVTNASRGVCYLKMNNITDAVHLHNALLLAKPVIDGKEAVVSYSRLDPAGSENSNSNAGKWKRIQSSLGSAAIAAAQWSHQEMKNSSQYTIDDVNKLAEYSASLYATNPQEKLSYLAYYQEYYRKQISEGKQVVLPATDSLASAPAASAVQADGKNVISPLTEPPNGSGSETYPVPDVSTYQYDKSSGYYYDPFTTLYYDANSQYYYNQKTQMYLYWDSTKNTYLPASTGNAPAANITATAEVQKEEELQKSKEKESDKDRVKIAKRIAKDMEKWAKTLNQKKEIAKQNFVSAAASQPSLKAEIAVESQPLMKAQGAADIGFSVLERKDLPVSSGLSIMAFNSHSNDGLALPSSSDGSLVAAYGLGSDSEDEQDDGSGQHMDDKQFTDWSKLACLLCKRQFPSKDVLVKHQQLSDLHKQNLEQWYTARGLDLASAQQKTQLYRDRAKERRLKYGEPDKPQPSRLKETYMKAREATITYEEPTKMGLGSDNRGNKLLQKMGWQEGMGLGKKNQGRTSIIETERRSATAGLGTKSRGVVPGPGETYKDCVKKMMKIRYQQIDEKS